MFLCLYGIKMGICTSRCFCVSSRSTVEIMSLKVFGCVLFTVNLKFFLINIMKY